MEPTTEQPIIAAVKWAAPIIVSIVVGVASSAFAVGTLTAQTESRFKKLETTELELVSKAARIEEQIEKMKAERGDLSTRLTVIETDLKWIRQTLERRNSNP